MSSEQSVPLKQPPSLNRTPDGKSAEMENPAGSINNASSLKPLSQDSALGTSTSSEIVDLSSLLAQMAHTVGSLVTEVGETNRMLKALMAEKHTEKKNDASEEMQYNHVPVSSLRSNQVPPQESGMSRLRDTFLKYADQNELVGHVFEPGYSGFFVGFDGAKLIVCYDETGSSGEGHKSSNAPDSGEVKTTARSREVLKISEALDLVRPKWPLNTVSKDKDEIIWRVITGDLLYCTLFLFDNVSNGGIHMREHIILVRADRSAPQSLVCYSVAIYRIERS